MLDFLFDGIASALSFLYDATGGSYAGSIMLLTFGVMILVTPLTLKSTRSMIAMQQLQPELRKLQAKHKDDRQKLNEEMMAFYKEHNISPLGGCLPLIVQTPVFIVLYQVLIGLTRQHGYGRDMGEAAGLLVRNPSGGGSYDLFGTFDPKYLEHTTNLYQDLSRSREMQDFGLDLADTFMNRLGAGGLAHAFPYLVLVLVVAVSAFVQQRQIMARQSGNQTQINPQQQALMKIMPFFLPVFSLTLPAGIVLYFVVSNLYRIAQQAFITRTMYSEQARERRDADLKSKGLDTPIRPSDTVPEGKKGLFGGLIHLPDRNAGANGSSKGKGKVDMAKSGARSGSKGSTPKGGSAKGGATKGGSAKAGSGSRAGGSGTKTAPSKGGANGSGAKGPNRQAPSRAAPSPQNRSKNKKKRK
jgi:YidC/Oxa1 family membrane protein insertase